MTRILKRKYIGPGNVYSRQSYSILSPGISSTVDNSGIQCDVLHIPGKVILSHGKYTDKQHRGLQNDQRFLVASAYLVPFTESLQIFQSFVRGTFTFRAFF